MWVCSCHGITDHEINALLAEPTVTGAADVGVACGAGTMCGGCLPEVQRLCAAAGKCTEASVSVAAVPRV